MLTRLSKSIRTALLRLEKKRITSRILNRECEMLSRSLVEADVSLCTARKFSRQVAGDLAAGGGTMAADIFAHRLERMLTGEKPVPVLRGKIFMVGLNGAGKTTTACKIAKKLKSERGMRVCLVAGDLSRPAATEQLTTLGKKAGADIRAGFGGGVAEVAKTGRDISGDYDAVIFDLAGRQDTDGGLLEELSRAHRDAKPDVVLLVCDGAGGQQMAEVGKAFAQSLRVDGIVLTKMDGDACGGGVLSVVEATGAPVVFRGTGEGLDDLDIFCPKRAAGRILGRGAAAGLIERLGEVEFGLEESLQRNKMDMDGFLGAMRMIRGLGSISGIAEAAGFSGGGDGGVGDEAGRFGRIEAVISSMSSRERKFPEILEEEGRIERIARGAGVDEGEVREVVGRFFRMRELL